MQKTAAKIVQLIQSGKRIVLTHGNGPQIGATLIRHEMASMTVPPFPLHACGAETQGFLGYIIQQSLTSLLTRARLETPVVSVVTQVIVDKEDPAFKNPTKPIGPFYDKTEKDELSRKRPDLTFREEPGKGFRRVVASPNPKLIVETDAIKALVSAGAIVVASGGGGIPVIQSPEKNLEGVDAVVDKDLAAERLATAIKAEELAILTDVEGVFINYRKKDQRLLTRVRSDELEVYARKGEFAAGSMGPKVEATLRFVKHGGRRAVIAALESVDKAMEGKSGTQIT